MRRGSSEARNRPPRRLFSSHVRSMTRSPDEVLKHLLDRRCRGDLEGDLATNYAGNVAVLSKDGVFHGHDGIRCTAKMLERMLPNANFSYDIIRTAGEVALLSWSARADSGAATCHGADTFLVRDGRIVAQTIHYEVGSAD